MNETEAFDSYLEVGNDVDLEFEGEKVEMGDNFVVFFWWIGKWWSILFYFCNKPLHRCQETFEDD